MHLNGGDAQGPDVCREAIALLGGFNDLWRHPVGRAHKGPPPVPQRSCMLHSLIHC